MNKTNYKNTRKKKQNKQKPKQEQTETKFPFSSNIKKLVLKTKSINHTNTH